MVETIWATSILTSSDDWHESIHLHRYTCYCSSVLILGMQWAHVALDEWSFFDMKIIGSFLLACVYGSSIIFASGVVS